MPLQPLAHHILGVQSQAADQHVFLVGRPPVGEYLGYIATHTLEGQTQDRGSLMHQWRLANDHIRELEQTEAGIADDARTEPLTEPLQARAAALRDDPAVANTYSSVPFDIAMVELDRLVVFQKHINLAYVEELQQQLPVHLSAEAIFDFALPSDGRNGPPIQAGPIGQNAFGFTSPSSDLRVLDLQVVDPRAVAGLSVGGRPAAILALIVGYGANLLSAVRAEGRLVLHNGSHRAHALRAAGHTHAPCLVQNVSRREELEVVSPEIQQRPELYLEAQRPPILKDYFDERLRLVVHVPRSRQQVQAVVNSQRLEVPDA
jgi:hypothetical protein